MFDMTNLMHLQGRLVLLLLVGFCFAKRQSSKEFEKGLTMLISEVVLPCNIVASFFMEMSLSLLRRTASIFLLSLINQLICLVLCRVAYRGCKEENQAVLKSGTHCSNAGSMGMCVAQGIWGMEAALLTSVYLIPQRIFNWSAGVSYFNKEKKNILLSLLKNRCVQAVIIGVFLMITQIRLPVFVADAINTLADCQPGLAMIMVGMIASRIQLRDFWDMDILRYCGVRLLLIPALIFGVGALMGADAFTGGVSVILAAMPMGNTVAVLAARHDCNPEFAARCIAASTVFSLLIAPVWGLLLLHM